MRDRHDLDHQTLLNDAMDDPVFAVPGRIERRKRLPKLIADTSRILAQVAPGELECSVRDFLG